MLLAAAAHVALVTGVRRNFLSKGRGKQVLDTLYFFFIPTVTCEQVSFLSSKPDLKGLTGASKEYVLTFDSVFSFFHNGHFE